MKILDIKDLVFYYGDKLILNHVDLTVEKGEVILLLGPNGCGKTTLIDCIAGYRNYTQGDIYIHDQHHSEHTVKTRAQYISYVPQSTSSVFPFTVLNIVLMGRTPYLGAAAGPSKEDIAIAKEALYQLGMEEFAERIFVNLSGGEKQLVMIARSIAQDSDIILLDEPTSALDIKNETIVLNRILEMTEKLGKTVILATHKPNHAFFIASKQSRVKVALFKDKKIKYYGNPHDIINEKTIKDVYDIDAKIINYDENRKILVVVEDNDGKDRRT